MAARTTGGAEQGADGNVRWQGAMGRLTFADEAEAVEWAKSQLNALGWEHGSVDVGEIVPMVGGGNYARPKKWIRVYADGRVETKFSSAVCG